MSTPTLPEAAVELDDLLREYHRLSRLTLSIMKHLIEEQSEAVAPGAAQTGVSVSGGSYDNVAVMLARTAALAPYAYRGRRITDGIAEVRKSLRDWQRCLDDAISDRPPRNDEDRPRCPGVTEDANGRLGGCGNLTEKYHEGGKVKYRPYCKTCRTQGRNVT